MSKVFYAQGLTGCGAEPVPHPADGSGVTLGVPLGSVSVELVSPVAVSQTCPSPTFNLPCLLSDSSSPGVGVGGRGHWG